MASEFNGKKTVKRVIWNHRFLRRTPKCRCPGCGEKTFSPYYNIETGQVWDRAQFGKCDRAINCNYHKEPRIDDYYARGWYKEVEIDEPLPKATPCPKVEKMIQEEEDSVFSSMEPKQLLQTLTTPCHEISLYRFLINYFPENIVQDVFRHYVVGYSDRYKGSPVFWIIDMDGNIRTGKVMGYNDKTGKRRKNPPQISFLHTPDREVRDTIKSQYYYKQCLYGEHLIRQYEKFAIVESEKTALICTMFAWMKQDYSTLWLATGGLENIRDSLMRPLEGKNVQFYPDKGEAAGRWEKRINEKLSPEIRVNFKINLCIEKVAILEDGDDIGDYILKMREKQ